MKRRGMFLLLAAAALALTVTLAAPAWANRTWVSSGGNDANPCSHASPCLTFSGALAKTSAGGQINCIDGGSFGPVAIAQSVTIDCEAVIGHITDGGTKGIVVTLPSTTDVVRLRGLEIDGIHSPDGLDGILFDGAGTLHVEKLLIHDFASTASPTGINFIPNNNAALFVTDTIISEIGNGAFGNGIIVKPTGSHSVNVSLERVQIKHNDVGFQADATNASPLRVTIANSLSSGNLFAGFLGRSTSGPMVMMLNHTTSSNNGSFGVRGDGANVTLQFGSSVIAGNVTGVKVDNGATVQSYQNNQINQNGTDGTPVPSVALH